MLPSMTLREYLHKHDIKPGEFAKRIGVTVTSVYRYRDGIRKPDAEVMPRIVAATQGAVTANDFWLEKESGEVAA
jgi:transcriptional regulator with XRE-family HTH domain